MSEQDQRVAALVQAAQELVDVLEDENYQTDSFTAQPLRRALRSFNEQQDRTPELKLEIWLVEYGIQANIYLDGELKHELCRDFAKEHPLSELKAQLLSFVYTMINLYVREQHR